MIPYVHPFSVQVGPLSFGPFHAMVLAAIAVGVLLSVWRAPVAGFRRREAALTVAVMLVMGLLGSRWLALASNDPDTLAENPLGVLLVWRSMSSVGGFVGGLTGLALCLRFQRRTWASRLAFADVVAFAFPFAWTLGRIGCALAHDHPGRHTTSWIAVQYPGGPRFDLGLMEAIFSALLACVFIQLARKQRPAGFFVGVLFLSYGAVRFSLDFLRAWDPRYAGLTIAQWASTLFVFTGAAVVLWYLRGNSGRRAGLPSTLEE